MKQTSIKNYNIIIFFLLKIPTKTFKFNKPKLNEDHYNILDYQYCKLQTCGQFYKHGLSQIEIPTETLPEKKRSAYFFLT